MAGYERFAKQLVALPFLLGFHMFAWVDEPGAGNGWGENSNYGLVHLDDEPYKQLTTMFSSLNRNVSTLHKVPTTFKLACLPFSTFFESVYENMFWLYTHTRTHTYTHVRTHTHMCSDANVHFV